MEPYMYREKNHQLYFVDQIHKNIITINRVKSTGLEIVAVFRVTKWIQKYKEA